MKIMHTTLWVYQRFDDLENVFNSLLLVCFLVFNLVFYCLFILIAYNASEIKLQINVFPKDVFCQFKSFLSC